MKFPFNHILLVYFLWFPVFGFSNSDQPEKKYTISGRITDQQSGETLPGATVFVKEIRSGTVSNSYGYYALRLPAGTWTIVYTYVGYESVTRKIQLVSDITVHIEMAPSVEVLQEIVISGERDDRHIRSPETGFTKVESKTIGQIPALFGEIDVIRAIQLLPGVKMLAEGSTGFSVRGGNADQNLVLLDEATVYNAGHLLGFFSVFNNDAIKEVTFFKGDIPASQGGRLSSLMDVRMKDGNNKSFHMTGGIGMISSRFTVEGPIVRDQTSFLVSGRRTYADLFLPLAKNPDIRDNKLFFYDLNAKITHNQNEKNRFFASAYAGRDIFRNQFAEMTLGNRTMTFRWNRLFSSRLFSNFTVLGSRYDYRLGTPEGEPGSFEWISRLTDHAIKGDFTWYLDVKNTVRFGASTVFHQFNPGVARGLGEQSFFSEYRLPENYSLESGLYLQNEQQVNDLLTLRYGLRVSMFQNIGPAVVYHYDASYQVTDSSVYSRGQVFKTFVNLEPRIGASYLLNEFSSLKMNYSRAVQYVHLAQNSTAGTPLDIWFPSGPNIAPQKSDQFAAGYFRNFRNGTMELSMEVYHKSIANAIDFKDHAQLLLNRYLDGELRIGKAWSYGAEFMLRKVSGKFTGWASYTLSKAERKVKGINNDKPFRSPYDKPHDITLVTNYDINPRWSVAVNWVYTSGRPVTFPVGRAFYGNAIIPVYSDRNAYRLPDYHRMDLSVTYRMRPPKSGKWHSELNLSVYNAYARKNVWTINFVNDPKVPYSTYAEATYLFSIIPALTYNFRF